MGLPSYPYFRIRRHYIAWDINLWIDKSQTKKLKYITVRFYINSDSKFFEKHLDEDVFKDDASKLNHKIKRKNNNESYG